MRSGLATMAVVALMLGACHPAATERGSLRPPATVSPVVAEEPLPAPDRPRRRSYARQQVAVDLALVGGAVLTIPYASEHGAGTTALLWYAGYLFAGTTLHSLHGNSTQSLLSFLRRLLFTAPAAIAAGYTFENCADDADRAGCDRDTVVAFAITAGFAIVYDWIRARDWGD
jgi:hypothetical protein